MVTKDTESTPENPQERHQFQETLRKLLMAGIGAVALAQDEIEAVINKLVERGELAEKDGKKIIQDMLDKRKQETKKVEEDITKRAEEILRRLNIPTKADIEALSKKINALSKKVDELKKSPPE